MFAKLTITINHSVFVLEADLELPALLVSFIRLLLLDEEEWKSIKMKSKPPKPKTDAQLLDIIHELLETRLKAYPTTLQVCGMLA